MGTVGLVDAALPHLVASGAGSIVTIASVSGREIDFAAARTAFKAAIIHYTPGLAYNSRRRVSGPTRVTPGNTYFAGGVWQSIEQSNPELFATSLALNPTGRMATPEEVARTPWYSSPARGQPHHRHQPRRRRCAHPWRPVIARRAKPRRTSTGRAQGPSPLGLGIR